MSSSSRIRRKSSDQSGRSGSHSNPSHTSSHRRAQSIPNASSHHNNSNTQQQFQHRNSSPQSSASPPMAEPADMSISAMKAELQFRGVDTYDIKDRTHLEQAVNFARRNSVNPTHVSHTSSTRNTNHHTRGNSTSGHTQTTNSTNFSSKSPATEHSVQSSIHSSVQSSVVSSVFSSASPATHHTENTRNTHNTNNTGGSASLATHHTTQTEEPSEPGNSNNYVGQYDVGTGNRSSGGANNAKNGNNVNRGNGGHDAYNASLTSADLMDSGNFAGSIALTESGSELTSSPNNSGQNNTSGGTGGNGTNNGSGGNSNNSNFRRTSSKGSGYNSGSNRTGKGSKEKQERESSPRGVNDYNQSSGNVHHQRSMHEIPNLPNPHLPHVPTIPLTPSGKLLPQILHIIQTSADPSMTTIDLDHRHIGDTEVFKLAEALTTNTTVTKLSLKGCSISDKGCSKLADALLRNTHVKELYLDENSIGKEGAAALSTMLITNETLGCLTLKDNGKIGEGGVVYLMGALEHNSTLRVLEMEGCGVSKNEGGGASGAGGGRLEQMEKILQQRRVDSNFESLLERLLDDDFRVTGIDLSGRAIGDLGAKRLAEALADNTQVRQLWLRGCDVGDKGATALASCLEQNMAIVDLFLGNNIISNQGVKAISDALALSNLTLVSLEMDDNRVGDDGIDRFVEALDKNTSVLVASFENNEVKDEEKLEKLQTLLAERRNGLNLISFVVDPEGASTCTDADDSGVVNMSFCSSYMPSTYRRAGFHSQAESPSVTPSHSYSIFNKFNRPAPPPPPPPPQAPPSPSQKREKSQSPVPQQQQQGQAKLKSQRSLEEKRERGGSFDERSNERSRGGASPKPNSKDSSRKSHVEAPPSPNLQRRRSSSTQSQPLVMVPRVPSQTSPPSRGSSPGPTSGSKSQSPPRNNNRNLGYHQSNSGNSSSQSSSSYHFSQAPSQQVASLHSAPPHHPPAHIEKSMSSDRSGRSSYVFSRVPAVTRPALDTITEASRSTTSISGSKSGSAPVSEREKVNTALVKKGSISGQTVNTESSYDSSSNASNQQQSQRKFEEALKTQLRHTEIMKRMNHYAAIHFRSKHFWLWFIPISVCIVVAGILSLASAVAVGQEPGLKLSLVSGLFALFAFVLNFLQTQFGWSGRAQVHRNAELELAQVGFRLSTLRGYEGNNGNGSSSSASKAKAKAVANLYRTDVYLQAMQRCTPEIPDSINESFSLLASRLRSICLKYPHAVKMRWASGTYDEDVLDSANPVPPEMLNDALDLLCGEVEKYFLFPLLMPDPNEVVGRTIDMFFAKPKPAEPEPDNSSYMSSSRDQKYEEDSYSNSCSYAESSDIV